MRLFDICSAPAPRFLVLADLDAQFLRLFVSSFLPYLRTLETWVSQGRLLDPVGELLISANSEVHLDRAEYWRRAHNLRPQDAIPTETPAPFHWVQFTITTCQDAIEAGLSRCSLPALLCSLPWVAVSCDFLFEQQGLASAQPALPARVVEYCCLVSVMRFAVMADLSCQKRTRPVSASPPCIVYS
eukprot:5000354-Pleurochrysis_carterae.AAC.1